MHTIRNVPALDGGGVCADIRSIISHVRCDNSRKQVTLEGESCGWRHKLGGHFWSVFVVYAGNRSDMIFYLSKTPTEVLRHSHTQRSLCWLLGDLTLLPGTSYLPFPKISYSFLEVLNPRCHTAQACQITIIIPKLPTYFRRVLYKLAQPVFTI